MQYRNNTASYNRQITLKKNNDSNFYANSANNINIPSLNAHDYSNNFIFQSIELFF